MLGISVESTTDDGGSSTSDIHIKMTIPIKYTTVKPENSLLILGLLQIQMLVRFRLILLINKVDFEVMDNLTLPVTNDWQSWTTVTKNTSNIIVRFIF